MRFSTWLLSIARHVFGDEVDRRLAAKRIGGRRAVNIDDAPPASARTLDPDDAYEREVFRAKVLAAIRSVEARSEFLPFEVQGRASSRAAAAARWRSRSGASEPTVTRHLQKVRAQLREELVRTVAAYSFTEDESREAERAGLAAADAAFDAAVAEIYLAEQRRAAPGGGSAGWGGVRYGPRRSHS